MLNENLSEKQKTFFENLKKTYGKEPLPSFEKIAQTFGFKHKNSVWQYFKKLKDSDLIIVTAGKSRNANQTRLDLAFDNIKIADSIATEFEKYYTKGVILIVSNPVDIITHYFTKRLALPQGKIFGTGCILDGSRLVNVLSDYLNLGPEFINISVIGEHGNSQIPVWSHAEAAQIPLEDYCKVSNILFDKKIKEEMEEKVLKMGTEIISGKGKTFYGISTCVCYIADAILNNNPVQASVSSFMTGFGS